MLLRVLSFLLMIAFVTSCNKISFFKKTDKKAVDIVDFSSVDTFPSFKNCDSLIDKTKKSDCFRNTIHKKIGAELQQHSFIIEDSINEIVYVALSISSKGFFTIDSIQSSEKIKSRLPKLDSLLEKSVAKLPKIYPAIKRGIPVTTKYKLPIHIELKE